MSTLDIVLVVTGLVIIWVFPAVFAVWVYDHYTGWREDRYRRATDDIDSIVLNGMMEMNRSVGEDWRNRIYRQR